MRALLLLLLSGNLAAQVTVRQGDALKLDGPAGAVQARLHEITVPLFASFGLMPVDAELAPGVYPLEYLDASDGVVQTVSVTVRNAHFHKDNVVIPQALTELKSTADETKVVHAFLTTVTPDRFWEEPFGRPVPGCMNTAFGSGRLYNGKPTGDYHRGVDQHGALGTPIHAVAAGTVRLVRQLTVSGGTVGIDHGQGLESMYLHQSRFAVSEGQRVEAGDVIGYVGSTGRSTGPHLHWALYANGHAVNPGQWVKLVPCGVGRKKK